MESRTWRRQLPHGKWRVLIEFEAEGRRYVLLAEEDPLGHLTARERDVLARASGGSSNKAVAYDLGVSASTVRVLMARACRKLGAPSRAAAIEAFRTRVRGP